MPIAGILRRWVLVSAVTGVLALIQVPGVRAQAVQPVPMPPNPNPNQPVNGPRARARISPYQCPRARGPLNSPANGDTEAPGWCLASPPARPPPQVHTPVGPLDPGSDPRIALRRHLLQGGSGSLDASPARHVLHRGMGPALRASDVRRWRLGGHRRLASFRVDQRLRRYQLQLSCLVF